MRREENLVDLETDKVVLEVPAPADGVLKQIVAADGAVVTSGQVLAVLEPGAVAAAAAPAAKPAAAAAPAPPPPKSTAPPPKPMAPTPASERQEPEASIERTAGASANRMGPAVRKLVEEHDIDPKSIAGSGREGRITKGDVLDYLADHQATTVGIEHDVLAQAGVAGREPLARGPSRAEQRVPMTRLRARIAERLLQAQQQAAMLTTFNDDPGSTRPPPGPTRAPTRPRPDSDPGPTDPPRPPRPIRPRPGNAIFRRVR